MNFLKRKKPEAPAEPITTSENLRKDGSQAIGGAWNLASGTAKTIWHTYTGTLKGTFGYMANHPNQAGVLIATAAAGYIALQNETVSQKVDAFLNAATATACENGLGEITPEICEDALILKLENGSLTNG